VDFALCLGAGRTAKEFCLSNFTYLGMLFTFPHVIRDASTGWQVVDRSSDYLVIDRNIYNLGG
jgi:hypothetical protein